VAIERRKSRQIAIGDVLIGGDAPVSIQSMTTTKTADINATLQQIASLVAAGVDIVRVAVPHWEDAEALVAIAAKSTVPVVADIHFQWKYAMAALEAGIQGLRINPGNIKYQDKVRLIAREAKDRGVPIRIGVNAGSLEKELLEKYGSPTPEALVESALNEARILEDEEFFDIKISVKHSNPLVMIEKPATIRCISASPRPARCRWGASRARSGSERSSPRGSATRSVSPSPTTRWRRSRRARRSFDRWACGSAASTWWPAPRAAAPR
jgi:1-hydroxy-2-methyl-2-(E)-butenyl 4-diphosphate synthase